MKHEKKGKLSLYSTLTKKKQKRRRINTEKAVSVIALYFVNIQMKREILSNITLTFFSLCTILTFACPQASAITLHFLLDVLTKHKHKHKKRAYA